MIQERFNELQPYLRGVKIADKYAIVECIIKNTWKIDGITPEGVTYKSSGKEPEDHKGFTGYMFWSEDTIDNLVDTLEHIINTNIEIEQKQTLLKSKVEELKKMFESKSLDELKGLTFHSEMDIALNPTPKTNDNKVAKEEKETNNVTTEKV